MSGFAVAWNAIDVPEGVRQILVLFTLAWLVMIVFVSVPLVIYRWIQNL